MFVVLTVAIPGPQPSGSRFVCKVPDTHSRSVGTATGFSTVTFCCGQGEQEGPQIEGGCGELSPPGSRGIHVNSDQQERLQGLGRTPPRLRHCLGRQGKTGDGDRALGAKIFPDGTPVGLSLTPVVSGGFGEGLVFRNLLTQTLPSSLPRTHSPAFRTLFTVGNPDWTRPDESASHPAVNSWVFSSSKEQAGAGGEWGGGPAPSRWAGKVYTKAGI